MNFCNLSNSWKRFFLCDPIKLITCVVIAAIMGFSIMIVGVYFCVNGKYTDAGAFFTAAAGMFTATAFLYGVHIRKLDEKERTSEFYLEKIREYFKVAELLIRSADNNHIKWHRAIQSLKAADSLRQYLTEIPHQAIYVIDHINTAFSIVAVLDEIDNFRFFYGVRGYEKISPEKLFELSSPYSPTEKNFRVSPEALSSLVFFIGKANQAFSDLERNLKNREQVFKSEYFNARLSGDLRGDPVAKITSKIIYDYIEDFFERKAKRNREKMNEQINI